jgi:hypothetical protein
VIGAAHCRRDATRGATPSARTVRLDATDGAIFAKVREWGGRLAAIAMVSSPTQPAMDASLYFRLTDRIDGASSLEELADIEAEIERTQPHVMERRALERRLNRRERALVGTPLN